MFYLFVDGSCICTLSDHLKSRNVYLKGRPSLRNLVWLGGPFGCPTPVLKSCQNIRSQPYFKSFSSLIDIESPSRRRAVILTEKNSRPWQWPCHLSICNRGCVIRFLMSFLSFDTKLNRIRLPPTGPDMRVAGLRVV